MRKFVTLTTALAIAALSATAVSAKSNKRHHSSNGMMQGDSRSGQTTGMSGRTGGSYNGGNAAMSGNNGNSGSGSNSLGHIKGGNIGAGK